MREPSIYHKNLMPVVYVTADVAGHEESPVYPILKLDQRTALDETARGVQHGNLHRPSAVKTAIGWR